MMTEPELRESCFANGLTVDVKRQHDVWKQTLCRAAEHSLLLRRSMMEMQAAVEQTW